MAEVPTTEGIAAITDPRQRLVAAGARALIDDGFRILASGLSPERIAALAGRSRRTFYEHFDTKEDFLRAVFARHLEPSEEVLTTQRLAEDVLATIVTDEGASMLDTIDELTRRQYVRNTLSDGDRVGTVAWSAAGADPATHAASQAYLRAIDELWEQNVQLALDTWGLAMRPPWTAAQLGQAIVAISDGFYARTRIDDDDHAEDFSRVLTTLIATAVQRLDERPEQLDDRLASLRRAAAIGVRERHDPAAAVTARRRLLDALADALEVQRLDQLTLTDVADRAGVGLGTVRASFGDLIAVLAELVADRLPPFDREIDFDRRTTEMGTAALLRRHLARLRAWSDANPGIAGAVASAVTDPPEAGSALMQSLIGPAAALLRRAHDEREFAVPVMVEPVAAALTFGSLGATLIQGSPTDADWLVDAVIRGLMTPPDAAESGDRAETRTP